MSRAVQPLRDAIDAFHRQRSAADIAYFGRGELDETWRSTADSLLGERGDELFYEARGSHELDAEQHAAMLRQRAFVAAHVELAGVRRSLHAFMSTKLPCASSAVPPAALLDSLLGPADTHYGVLAIQALADALGARAADLCEARGAADDALLLFGGDPKAPSSALACAEALLRATDDAAQDLVPWLVRTVAPRAGAPAHALLLALRQRELDGFAKADRRFFRLAAGLRGLGFERDLNARVRVEGAPHAAFIGAARSTPNAVPRDVRFVSPTRNFGVLSDVEGAAAVGGGLALALVSPALPVELRWPTGQGVPDALGALLQRLRADRLYLRRIEGLNASDAEKVARHAAIILLLAVRASAALELAAGLHARNSAERSEALTAGLSRALTLDLPTGFAVLAWSSLPVFQADLRGRLAGFALHPALRDHFDEDWFENPRAAEPLRGAAARGNTLAAEGFCAELGTELGAGVKGLLELLA